MARNVEYQYVSTDVNSVISLLTSAYEKITGTAVQPSSPEKLFLQWAAGIVVQEREQINHAGNQNLPSRAEGKNLDAIGEELYRVSRPAAQPAVCTERFFLSAVQSSAILIPGGTRVTDAGSSLVWETVSDIYIQPGETYADVSLRCQTLGTTGNGYAMGQLNTLIDLFPYYDRCENLTVSDGGSDQPSDDEYYELIRSAMDSYSTAGPGGGYIYHAKKVSTEIADVVANSPEAGKVALYVLMKDGSIAQPEIKKAVLAACSSDTVRPLTDYVSVEDPEVVEASIQVTYYVPSDSVLSSAELEQSVHTAVQEYINWQCAKLGRDINPSKLISLLMQTGVKRVEVTSPSYQALRDGSDRSVPQIASFDQKSIINGGFEDE